MEDRAAESVDKWNRKKYTKYLEEEKVAQKGDLLSFRPDIKVLDATIRDGGLVNDFYFTNEFAQSEGKCKNLIHHGVSNFYR